MGSAQLWTVSCAAAQQPLPRWEAFKQGKAPKKCRGLLNSNAAPPKMQIPSRTLKQCHQDMMRLELLEAKERKSLWRTQLALPAVLCILSQMKGDCPHLLCNYPLTPQQRLITCRLFLCVNEISLDFSNSQTAASSLQVLTQRGNQTKVACSHNAIHRNKTPL